METIASHMLEVAAFTPLSLKEPYAWCGHIPFAAWLVKSLRPRLLVELGTHSGNSYFAFCQAVQQCGISTRCYAIDTWKGDEHSGGYGKEVYSYVNKHNTDNYSTFSTLLVETFDASVGSFADASIDLLHIDGLHTYAAVKHDFETWLPKLCPGALVLFHDTAVRNSGFGVWKFWEELIQEHPFHMEFKHSSGLGVIQVFNDCSSHAHAPFGLDWLRPQSSEQRMLVDYFTGLGSKVQAECLWLQCQKQVVELKQESVGNSRRIATLDKSLHQRNLEVAALDKQLNARNVEAAALDKQLNARNAEVAALDKQLNARNAEVAALDKQLNARNAEVAALDKQLNARNAEVAALDKQLNARNVEVAALDKQLNARNAEVAALDKQLNARNVEVAALDKQLNARNVEAAALDKQLDARNVELVELDKRLNQRNLEIIELNQRLHQRSLEVEELSAQLDRQHTEINSLKQQLNQITGSKMWQVLQRLHLVP